MVRLLLIPTLSTLMAGIASAGSAAEAPWSLHSAVNAPNNLKLSGSIRLRYEGLTGQPRAGLSQNTDLYSLRSTLFAEYTAGPLRFGGELYDSRAYGGTPRTGLSSNDVNAVELVQAYVAADWKTPFGPGSSASVQAGRFTLNLGSRRLVAADDYRNTTNGYTGVRLDAKARGGTTATFVFTAPQVRLPDDTPSLLDNRVAFDRESFDLVLWGGIVTKPKLFGRTDVDFSFFKVDERDAPRQATRNRRLSTVSARAIRNPLSGHFDYEVEGVYQFGSIASGLQPTGSRLDVLAYFVHADAGYQFRGAWSPRVSVEYDLASGDDGKASYGRFDTLFGMRRADLAPSGTYAAIGRANISTPGMRVEVTPSKRLDGFVSYRGLWLASATDSFSTTGVRDPSGAAGRYAGQQIEARLRYWLVPNALRLEADGVVLIKGRFLHAAPNAPRASDTRYFSLNLTSTF